MKDGLLQGDILAREDVSPVYREENTVWCLEGGNPRVCKGVGRKMGWENVGILEPKFRTTM